PDTQYYSDSYPATFAAQTQWIANNKAALNIVYVAHLGDIVNNNGGTASNLATQWTNASNAMYTLDAAGIPYSAQPGNHDYDYEDGVTDTGVTNFDNTFSAGRRMYFNGSLYGGHYGSTNDNNYMFFSASGMDFVVVNLAYDARYQRDRYAGMPVPPAAGTDPVLIWADSILKTYPNRRAIVVTHYTLNESGVMGNQGTAIYNALKGNPNLSMMLSGHMGGTSTTPGESRIVLGGNVNVLLSDYQSMANGGSGYLRIMTFSPSRNKIYVRTYSPTLDVERTVATSRFEISGFMNCQINLTANTHTCGGLPVVSMVQSPSGGQAVAKITTQLAGQSWSLPSVSFQVTYGSTPTGWTVNIGDSATNDGYGGDAGTQTRDAEMQVVGANMAIYGNDFNTPPGGVLKTVTGIANTSYPLNLQVKDQYLYWQMYVVNGFLNSPFLYALTGESDTGGVNYDIYAAFNRTIYDSTRSGTGVSTVNITFP
ncbi:MAG: metallophosphoesterase, partial [Anaerolineales bacterium]